MPESTETEPPGQGLTIPRVVVVGLGYVGLPLAVALARHYRVVGFDVNVGRVAELRNYHDRTNEVASSVLAQSSLKLTSRPDDCRAADIYIVTVPTPVDDENRPDLSALIAASRCISKLLDHRLKPIVVFESTVYPGVTEDICGPLLEEGSGLVSGQDFFLGYSPERINPGDRENTIERITKVVSGQNAEVTQFLAEIYGKITTGGIFQAASIKTAEAAKVIENAQRDINIAFMNEIAQIFSKLELSVWDVLDAAETKWNFLQFQPGLVGGHCIGVDPYYLSHQAQALGHDPQVILAGRSINDGMGRWIANSIQEKCGKAAASVLVMGVTFKENVPDLRNSRVVDLVNGLTEHGHQLTIHDPRADAQEALREYGLELACDALEKSYDIVVLAVAHREYCAMSSEQLHRLTRPGGCIADLKGIWRSLRLDDGVMRWSL